MGAAVSQVTITNVILTFGHNDTEHLGVQDCAPITGLTEHNAIDDSKSVTFTANANTDTPLPLTWKYQTTVDVNGNLRKWSHNNEQQGYVSGNDIVTVDGNIMHINIRARTECPFFESARMVMVDDIDDLKVINGNKLTIEFLAKLPIMMDSNGDSVSGGTTPLWPALWAMGSTVFKDTSDGFESWPVCAEIDIMELNGLNPVEPSHAFHFQGVDSDGNSVYDSQSAFYSSSGIDLTTLQTTFHYFTTELTYTSDSDRTIQFKIRNEAGSSEQASVVYDLADPKYDEFFKTSSGGDKHYGLLANIAYGGGFTGNPLIDLENNYGMSSEGL